jgi:hypothetical protein
VKDDDTKPMRGRGRLCGWGWRATERFGTRKTGKISGISLDSFPQHPSQRAHRRAGITSNRGLPHADDVVRSRRVSASGSGREPSSGARLEGARSMAKKKKKAAKKVAKKKKGHG